MREELITAACRGVGSVTGRLASRQDTVPPPNPRIVVLRRCCLGDVLGSTALIDALRRRYPLARIDYATSDYARPALAGNPDVSSVIPPEVAALRRGAYDVAITLERSPAAGMLPWLARIPIRVGLNSLSRGFAHNLRVACPPARSEAELALDCASALGVATADARAKFCPSARDHHRAEAMLAAEPELGLASVSAAGSHGPLPQSNHDGGWLAIAPGGGVNPGMRLVSKRWPAERYARLATTLAQQAGLRVVLLGADEDRSITQEILALAGGLAIDLTGRTSFAETAAVIQRARLFAGNDSAPLHLAAAVGTPFVGIFGPSDPARHRPFGRGEVVAAPVPPEAYRDGFTDLDCIGTISLEQVLAACRRLLAA